jgi:hypothetical protein
MAAKNEDLSVLKSIERNPTLNVMIDVSSLESNVTDIFCLLSETLPSSEIEHTASVW